MANVRPEAERACVKPSSIPGLAARGIARICARQPRPPNSVHGSRGHKERGTITWSRRTSAERVTPASRACGGGGAAGAGAAAETTAATRAGSAPSWSSANGAELSRAGRCATCEASKVTRSAAGGKRNRKARTCVVAPREVRQRLSPTHHRSGPGRVESQKGARERNRLRSAEFRILQLVISRCKCDCLANEKPPSTLHVC